MTRRVVNGVGLWVEEHGAGEPVLLLHGFTGAAENWDALLPYLDGYRAITVDLIGHGRSDCPPDPARFTMAHCVRDLTALLDELRIGRAAVAGYSMGGRIAMRFAIERPERVRCLVLESASPGIDDPGERAARRAADEALAGDIERDGVAAFVERWAAQPLFASQASLPEGARTRLREQRLRNDARGLANSLRGMGAGEDEPVYDRLAALAMPALIVAGEADAKYRAIAARTAGAIPGARLHVVAGAGHTTHLERPETFAAAVRAFLDETIGANAEASRKR